MTIKIRASQGAPCSPAALEGHAAEAAPQTVIFPYTFVLSARTRLMQIIEFPGWHTPCLLVGGYSAEATTQCAVTSPQEGMAVRIHFRKTMMIGLVGCGLALGFGPLANATPLPNLTNLNFLNYTGSAPKNYFGNVDPVGWTGGTGLIFIAAPGTDSTSPTTACGPTYLSTYGCPSTLSIPGGYNEVEADGNPSFESGFNYEVTGLTAGQTYTLSFYQAGSQQRGFGNNGFNTTQQWIVSLGTSGMTYCNGCGASDSYYGGNDSTYSNPDPNASVVATPLMTTPPGGLTDWQYVSINLTADASSDLLSFLAWGDNGNTVNLPPMVFLAGVNSSSGLNNVPEPSSLPLLGTGLGLLGIALWQRRRRERKSNPVV